MSDAALVQDAPKRNLEDWLAPDCAGENFFEIDRGLQDLLHLHMPDDLRRHMTPHFSELGAIAGGRLG